MLNTLKNSPEDDAGWIAEVITAHPDRTVPKCNKFHGNPSNICWGPMYQPHGDTRGKVRELPTYCKYLLFLVLSLLTLICLQQWEQFTDKKQIKRNYKSVFWVGLYWKNKQSSICLSVLNATQEAGSVQWTVEDGGWQAGDWQSSIIKAARSSSSPSNEEER